MREILVFNRSACTGCRYCEMVCSLRHEGLFRRSGSRIRIVAKERDFVVSAMYCRHCKTPVCIGLCNSGAITKDQERGFVSIDPEKCDGCGDCLKCPLGGIRLDKQSERAVNCDLCMGHPVCVEYCDRGALRYLSSKKPAVR